MIYIYIICSYFNSLKIFRTPILEPLGSHFANIAHKSRNQNIFEKFTLNRNLQMIPFNMMYKRLCYVIGSQMNGGGGGGPEPPSSLIL